VDNNDFENMDADSVMDALLDDDLDSEVPRDIQINETARQVTTTSTEQELTQNNEELQRAHQEIARLQQSSEMMRSELADAGIEIPLTPYELAKLPDNEAIVKIADGLIESGTMSDSTAEELAKSLVASNKAQFADQFQRERQAECMDPTSENFDPLESPKLAVLKDWMNEGGSTWESAKALDSQLMNSPEWQGKSVVDRFEYVQSQIISQGHQQQFSQQTDQLLGQAMSGDVAGVSDQQLEDILFEASQFMA